MNRPEIQWPKGDFSDMNEAGKRCLAMEGVNLRQAFLADPLVDPKGEHAVDIGLAFSRIVARMRSRGYGFMLYANDGGWGAAFGKQLNEREYATPAEAIYHAALLALAD